MLNFLWHSTAAWIGTAGLIVVACGVIAWFVPPLRRTAIGVGGLVLAAASIYAKGVRDRSILEQKRKEEAVRKAQADYEKIDARPDTADTTAGRLRDGSF